MAWGSADPRPTSTEFRQNRPLALKRDGGRCQLGLAGCTVQATEVDHVRNWKSGGTDSLDNLQSVCSRCHSKKTHMESRESWHRARRESVHPDHRMKHPGLL